MSYLNLVKILLTFSALSNLAADDCNRESFRETIELVKETIEEGEANSLIDQLKIDQNRCQFPLGLFGLNERSFSRFRQAGNMQEYLNARDRFDKQQYGDVEEIVELARTAGMRDQTVRRDLESRINQSKSQCGNVDLRNRLPPVRNQGNTTWCYAFAAADIASFHHGVNISPVDLAIQFNETRLGSVVRAGTSESQNLGGFIRTAVNQGLKNGFCLESNNVSTHQNNNELYQELEETVSEYYQLVDFHRGLLNASDEDIAKARIPYMYREILKNSQNEDDFKENMFHHFICNRSFNLYIMNEFFQGSNLQDITKVVLENDERSIIRAISSHNCSNRIQSDLQVATTTPVATYNRKVQLNHSLMDQNKIFAINYNVNFFSKKGIDGNHASTIVGRRWNESRNRCEFLLRNSFGRDCSFYKETFECSRGNVWISEYDLGQVAEYITYPK